MIDLEKERLEILKKYRKLLRAAKPMLQENDAKLIKKAFLIAADAHKEMRRKSGEPYIYHPLAVAQICVEEIGLGTTSIIAALLHDVVEDTAIPLSELEDIFGDKVALIIDGLTKIDGVFELGTSAQAENFRKMLLTLTKDVRVILIKLADRLHNMRTLSSMAQEKQLKIASETFYLYAPIAHRLGLHGIKTELEDLCLKYTEPAIYKKIAKQLSDTKTNRDSFINNFIKPLEKDLNKTGFNYVIKGRPKSIYSIHKKLIDSNIPFEEIYDLFAVRIILDVPQELEKSACWQVYSMVTDHYEPNQARLKDWVTRPKSNGYESLHITVMSSAGKKGRWVEVQIRTKRMDEIAEKGFAAHWKYKGNETRTRKGFDTWLTQISEALAAPDKSAVDVVDEIRSGLANEEEVFVFTPKGLLIPLPKGATGLDFAFEIHTEVGAKCMGVKVNGRLVPLSHKLSNGDQVEVITGPKQTPKEGWLKMVVTSKAKSRIRDFIKEENKQHLVVGRDMIEHRLKILGIAPLTLEVTNQLRAFFNAKDANDLFYRFGKGYIHLEELKKWKSARELHERKQAAKSIQEPLSNTKLLLKELKKLHGDQKGVDGLLIGEDMDKVDYTFAKCCNPISGDDVFAFVTINEGIKIHRNACPNATELLSRHGDRVMQAQWTSQVIMSFTADLHIKGTDRMGLISDLTTIISSELNVNIVNMNIGVNDGMFVGKISLLVQDTLHLELLLSQLEKVAGVVQVTREL